MHGSDEASNFKAIRSVFGKFLTEIYHRTHKGCCAFFWVFRLDFELGLPIGTKFVMQLLEANVSFGAKFQSRPFTFSIH